MYSSTKSGGGTMNKEDVKKLIEKAKLNNKNSKSSTKGGIAKAVYKDKIVQGSYEIKAIVEENKIKPCEDCKKKVL